MAFLSIVFFALAFSIPFLLLFLVFVGFYGLCKQTNLTLNSWIVLRIKDKVLLGLVFFPCRFCVGFPLSSVCFLFMFAGIRMFLFHLLASSLGFGCWAIAWDSNWICRKFGSDLNCLLTYFLNFKSVKLSSTVSIRIIDLCLKFSKWWWSLEMKLYNSC